MVPFPASVNTEEKPRRLFGGRRLLSCLWAPFRLLSQERTELGFPGARHLLGQGKASSGSKQAHQEGSMGSAGGHAQWTEDPNRLSCISTCHPEPHTAPPARKSFLTNVTELRLPVLGPLLIPTHREIRETPSQEANLQLSLCFWSHT